MHKVSVACCVGFELLLPVLCFEKLMIRTSRQLLSSDRDNSNTILIICAEKNASFGIHIQCVYVVMIWVRVKPGCNNVTRDLPAEHVVTKQPWKDADVCIHQIKQLQ